MADRTIDVADVVVCGAGVCGLTTAMLLAKAGHRVVVLERDPALPPEADRAWDDWERRGVNQFRLAHFLMPGFREVMDAELPEVIDALMAAGAYRFNPLGPFAETMDPTGDHVVVTARRPVVEAAVAAAATATEGVEIRRDVAVSGVVLDERDPTRVVGVRTEDGQEIRTRLLVDAGGRRSPLSRWLVEAGLPAPIMEEEDSGLVYYGRHVRMREGMPDVVPGIAFHGSVGLLVLPADRRTIGVGVIASSKDSDMRALRHEAPWRAALELLPGGDRVLACEFVSELIGLASIEDRWRRFVVDGAPVATGVLSVADAWAATNPTLGRGITLGAKHAVALRDVVREVGLDGPPEALALRFDEVTQAWFTPWYEATIWHDRHRLDDLDAAIAGGSGDAAPAPAIDERWEQFLRFESVAFSDPMMLMRMLDGLHLRQTPLEIVSDPVVLARLDELGAKVPPPSGPSREELLAAVRASAA